MVRERALLLSLLYYWSFTDYLLTSRLYLCTLSTLQVKYYYPHFPDLKSKTQKVFPWFFCTSCAFTTDALPFLSKWGAPSYLPRCPWRRLPQRLFYPPLKCQRTLTKHNTSLDLEVSIHPSVSPLLVCGFLEVRYFILFIFAYPVPGLKAGTRADERSERMREEKNRGHSLKFRDRPKVRRLWKNWRRSGWRCLSRTRVTLGLRKHWERMSKVCNAAERCKKTDRRGQTVDDHAGFATCW